LGTWFGIDAFSHWKKRNQHCSNGSCDSIAVREADSARDAARISNALFITAVVSAGAGITLVFTAKAPAAATRSAQAREDSPMMFFAQGQF
jgi:hypothetical protein